VLTGFCPGLFAVMLKLLMKSTLEALTFSVLVYTQR